MNIKDLLSAAVNKVRSTEMLSPVPANYSGQIGGGKQATYPEYMDALKASGRIQHIQTDNPQEFEIAKRQMKARSLGVDPHELEGWIPQSPETTIDLRQGGQPQLPPAQLPPAQVQGVANGDINFQHLIDVAKARAEAQGFHPAPIVSQMASESERGKSRFARERNNMFGIGAFDNNLDNTHRYGSPEESIDAYLKLISTDPRYAKAYEQRQDPVKYIQAIKDAGYATDPNYVRTTMNTPEWRSMMQ